jgi:folate-binding protein YgfZ
MKQLDPLSMQGAVHLSHWGVIRAQGPDAASFLQGQLTQDVQQLDQHGARLAGYCNAKGRLLASLLIWRPEPDQLLMLCSADLLPATLKRLSMFVMRAKCKLSDASASLAVYGLCGDAATRWLGANAPAAAWRCTAGAGGQALRLSDVTGIARYLWVQTTDATAPPLPVLAPGAWEWLEVGSGVARIVAATAEQFVPQMVNFELVGGVNFQKGCYPGQEVVARSQYRGSIKRRAFVVESAAVGHAGQEVFHSADASQPAGMVVNAASWDGATLALVEVKLAALETGSLHLGASEGPLLSLAQQPYAVNIDVTE